MVTITFQDRATERKALGFLLGRFSGRVLKNGEHIVPEAALEFLAAQNIPFTVKGTASYEPQSVQGHWRHANITYRDSLARLFVDVPDTAKNRTWMKNFKKRWKAKLRQLELWMISYTITIE